MKFNLTIPKAAYAVLLVFCSFQRAHSTLPITPVYQLCQGSGVGFKCLGLTLVMSDDLKFGRINTRNVTQKNDKCTLTVWGGTGPDFTLVQEDAVQLLDAMDNFCAQAGRPVIRFDKPVLVDSRNVMVAKYKDQYDLVMMIEAKKGVN